MATSLKDIITEVRNRADLNNSQFITDEEMTGYINYSYHELHGLLVNNFGGDYFIDETQLIVPAGTNVTTGSLPDNTLKVMGVDLQLGNKWVTLQPFNFNERNRASAMNVQGYATQNYTTYRYRIRNNKMVLTPAATGDVNLRIWTVPDVEDLVLGNDDGATSFVGVNNQIGGWVEYIIVDTCIKCKEKEETDYSGFLRQKDALIRRIQAEVQNRDQGDPAVVTDGYATGIYTDTNGTFASRYWDWYW